MCASVCVHACVCVSVCVFVCVCVYASCMYTYLSSVVIIIFINDLYTCSFVYNYAHPFVRIIYYYNMFCKSKTVKKNSIRCAYTLFTFIVLVIYIYEYRIQNRIILVFWFFFSSSLSFLLTNVRFRVVVPNNFEMEILLFMTLKK